MKSSFHFVKLPSNPVAMSLSLRELSVISYFSYSFVLIDIHKNRYILYGERRPFRHRYDSVHRCAVHDDQPVALKGRIGHRGIGAGDTDVPEVSAVRESLVPDTLATRGNDDGLEGAV